MTCAVGIEVPVAWDNNRALLLQGSLVTERSYCTWAVAMAVGTIDRHRWWLNDAEHALVLAAASTSSSDWFASASVV